MKFHRMPSVMWKYFGRIFRYVCIFFVCLSAHARANDHDCIAGLPAVFTSSGYLSPRDCEHEASYRGRYIGEIRSENHRYEVYQVISSFITEVGVRHGHNKLIIFENGHHYIGSYNLDVSGYLASITQIRRIKFYDRDRYVGEIAMEYSHLPRCVFINGRNSCLYR